MKRWRYRIGVILLLVMLPMIWSIGQKAAAEETEVVRVGVYEMTGFQEKDERGNYSGYNIDCLKIIAMETGWVYEYVAVGSLEQGIEMLEAQQIDLIAPCVMTADYMERFDFCQYPLGLEYSVLMTGDDRENVYYEDYASFENMKVAVVKGYPMTEYFLQYMEQNQFAPQLIYYENVWQAVSAVDNGEVDAAVTTMMSAEGAYKVLARFMPTEYYYMTWKGNDALLGKLNRAMQDIEYNYPKLLDEMYSNYFGHDFVQYFTKEEEELIASVGTLRVGYVPGRIPVSYTDEETGELAGISRELFDRIQEISGLRFEYVELPYGSVTYEYLLQNGIDMVTGVEYDSLNVNAQGMQLSTVYMDSAKVMVGREDLVFDINEPLKIAVATGSQTMKKILKEEYPNFYIVNYQTTEECFRALNDREVDLLIQNQYVVNYYLTMPHNEGLKIIPIAGLDDALCFATLYATQDREGRSEQESAKLTVIINKAISQISNEEIDQLIIKESTSHRYEYTIWDTIYKHRVAVIVISVALIVVFGVLVYIILMQRKLQNRDRQAEERIMLQQKRYRLILDHMDDMIYEISLHSDSCFSSERIREKFGWDIPKHVDSMEHHHLAEIMHIHPEDEPLFRQSNERLQEGVSDQILLRIMRTDGKFLWCSMTRHPVLDADGKMVSIVGKMEDVDSEKRLQENLTIQSRTDRLTGLLQKKVFEDEVTEYLSQNAAKQTCFIFVDMDNFKDVNDKLGHDMGDRAIIDIAKKLQVIFANCDLVSRFGGDEFCVFVKDIPRETLENKLKWCQTKLVGVYTDGVESVTTTASIGVAYCMAEATDYKTLFRVADSAVYEVKENGRNHHRIKDIEK